MYRIQYQSWFMWVDHMSIPDDMHQVAYYLEQAKQDFPDKRVRCVDEDGRLIDMIS